MWKVSGKSYSWTSFQFRVLCFVFSLSPEEPKLGMEIEKKNVKKKNKGRVQSNLCRPPCWTWNCNWHWQGHLHMARLTKCSAIATTTALSTCTCIYICTWTWASLLSGSKLWPLSAVPFYFCWENSRAKKYM